jgi:hypothetical protein
MKMPLVGFFVRVTGFYIFLRGRFHCAASAIGLFLRTRENAAVPVLAVRPRDVG